MITCAKCHTKFPVELNKIAKDSIVPCIHCKSSCLVRLFDLEDHVENTEGECSGFGDINKNLYTNTDVPNVEKNDTSQYKHFVIIIIILKALLIAFILGIIKIEFIDAKFPMLSKFYKTINILPKKTIMISKVDFSVVNNTNDQEYLSLTLTIKMNNIGDKTDLISDLTVLVFDAFYNVIAVSELQPYVMLKPDEEFDLQLAIPPIINNARYLSILLNGKIQIENINIQKKILNK
jgi:hypothetical protein